MIGRAILAFAVAFGPLFAASPAFAQADHAQRLATELAQRRAQVRVALCQQRVPVDQLKLPTYPPVGTGGPVPQPACPATSR